MLRFCEACGFDVLRARLRSRSLTDQSSFQNGTKFLLTNLPNCVYLVVKYTLHYAKSFACRRSKATPRFAGFWPKSSAHNPFPCRTSGLRDRNSFSLTTICVAGGWHPNGATTREPVHLSRRFGVSPLPSALPYVSLVTPLSTALTHFDRRGRGSHVHRSGLQTFGLSDFQTFGPGTPFLSRTCRLFALSLQQKTPSFRLFSAAYRHFLQTRGVALLFAVPEPRGGWCGARRWSWWLW